jgi:hypothetical protein
MTQVVMMANTLDPCTALLFRNVQLAISTDDDIIAATPAPVPASFPSMIIEESIRLRAITSTAPPALSSPAVQLRIVKP